MNINLKKNDKELNTLFHKYNVDTFKKDVIGEIKEKIKIPPTQQKTYDLHGFFQSEALHKLDYIFEEIDHQDLQRIKIITGKGEGILFKLVKKYLQIKKRVINLSFTTQFDSEFDIWIKKN